MARVPELSTAARLKETFLFLFLTSLKRSTVAGMFVLVLFRDTSVIAQMLSGGPLGAVSFENISDAPSLPLVGKFTSSSFPDFVYFNQPDSSLVVLSVNNSGAVTGRREIGRTSGVTFLADGDLNHDGIDDIVVVHRETNEVEVFLSSGRDSAFRSQTYKVNFYPEQALIADIDGDNNPDVMVFGKLTSGISVLRGNGAGGFAEVENIFSDIPVADAAVVKLNDDEFPDIVIHNWLTNEYLFYFGMGDLQFSEQNVLSFGQDSVSVFFGDFDGDFITDFGVAFLQKNILELYRGNGMVNFEHYQTLEYSGAPQQFFTFPIHSKSFVDIVTGDQRNGTFGVFENVGEGRFKDEIIFGCLSNYAALLPGDFDGDRWNDLAVVGHDQKQISFYWNTHRSLSALTASDEISFAAGKKPSGIAVYYFDRGKRDEIAVVNELSSTLSLYHNVGAENYFAGQIAFQTVEAPSAVRVYAQTDTSVTFLVSHESVAKVSVLTIDSPPHSGRGNDVSVQQDFSSFTYSIPTAERPRVFLPDASLQDKTIEFYVYTGARQYSLSYFRQVSGTRFIERSFKPIIPAKLLAAAVNDYNDDGKPDLAYIYYENGTGKYNLGITFSDSAGEYRGKTLSYIFPDSVMKRSYLTFADVNGDGIQDCILYAAPSNDIRLALGKGGGRFGDFSPIINNVLITQPDQIQVVDVDGDGISDIAVQNATVPQSGSSYSGTSSLLFLKGKGNGTFYAPKFLLSLPLHAIFRFGDFDGDGNNDIAFTDPERDVVTIKFVRGKLQ